MSYQYDLLIIGAGPGGYEAAFYAQELGMNVAVVEKDRVGGTCLNRGCIPTKALMHSSDVYREAAHGAEVGVEVTGLKSNRKRIGERKDEVLDTLRGGITGLLNKKKIDLIEGEACITGEHMVKVGDDEYTAENIMVATGSRPFMPPIPGYDLPGVIDSTDLIEMGGEEIPEFVIIGGGVIGIEFATIYADLGDHVTVIEGMDRLLPVIDKEIGRSIKMTLEKKGVDVHVSSPVQKIEKDGDKLVVTLKNKKDEEIQVRADKVLMCVGRRPNTAGVFSEELLAKYPDLQDAKGFIKVDDRYATPVPGVYAIGDCIGGIQLAHVASAEGRNAVAMINGCKATINMGTVPSCIYTDPEIAVVGMTADEAKEAGIEVVTKKYPMSANGKTIIAGLDRGFVKLVARADDHVLVGAHLLCGRASDLIGELSVAIGRGMMLEEVANIIHPHPSFAEAIMEAARL
ncbi:MAG: dihydrolipoyl dehydrogenase [Clostridiales bacterium]|jgi:dihydrolipoamide dehydrogenase|nr:dihydrolipoyl dehydrogenase [Clostridiales bacterium]